MSDKTLTNKQSETKTDDTSAAFLAAKKQLDATLISQTSLGSIDLQSITNLNRSSDNSGHSPLTTAKTTTTKPTPLERQADNGLLHPTGLAITSTAKGLWEPVAGTIQISEQVANAVTEHTPGVNKAYFHPEALSPNKEPTAPKYSGEWFVTNIFENVGKLPWYLLTAKGASEVPGFGGEVGLLSERRLMGMNLKSAAASGIIVGAMNPTDVQQDGSLVGSFKERGSQAIIGGVQIGLVTLGTSMAGKGAATAEKMFADGGEASTTEQTLARTACLTSRSPLQKAASATLKFTKNGSIATVGAIPAGLAGGYANAKLHGTEFDPAENVVAMMTVGFTLGGFGGGTTHEKAAMGNRAAAPATGRVEARTATTTTAESGIETVATPAAPAPVTKAHTALTTTARGQIRNITARTTAILAGGATPEMDVAFNGYDGVPNDGAATPGSTGKTTTGSGDRTAPTDAAPKGTKEPSDPTKTAATPGENAESPKTTRAKGPKAGDTTDTDASATAPKETKFRAKFNSTRASFEKGFDLLRNVAEATKATDLRDAQTALQDFVVNSDDALPAKNQLRSAAQKMGGDELQKLFDQAIDKRYVVAGKVHQVTGDHARFPGDPNHIVEVRATQLQRFKDIVLQARMVAEGRTGTEPEITNARGKVVESKSTPEQRYARLRQMDENLDPDLKASLVDYANKTNDLHVRALINDLLTNPKGEQLPSGSIYLPHSADIEGKWHSLYSRLAEHPKPAATGEAPSPIDVAQYRHDVFQALNELNGTEQGKRVIELAKQYSRQTNNSWEASALDYYFGGNRLESFSSVRESKVEASNARENRNTFTPKPAVPPPLDLIQGEMKPGNGFLDRVRARLGDKDAPQRNPWENGSVEAYFNYAENTLVDSRGVKRATFSGREDGLTKVISEPDTVSGIRGGKHAKAIFENNPYGIHQMDDFADGTRWIRQQKPGEPPTLKATFPDGSNYIYVNENSWMLDFPNGNYIEAYAEGAIAREISENDKVTQVMRIRPNYMKMSNLRGLGELFDSGPNAPPSTLAKTFELAPRAAIDNNQPAEEPPPPNPQPVPQSNADALKPADTANFPANPLPGDIKNLPPGPPVEPIDAAAAAGTNSGGQSRIDKFNARWQKSDRGTKGGTNGSGSNDQGNNGYRKPHVLTSLSQLAELRDGVQAQKAKGSPDGKKKTLVNEEKQETNYDDEE